MDIIEYHLKKDNNIKDITNNNIKSCNECICSKACKECKGACCVGTPCAFSPNDFIDITNINYMKSILNTGLFTISDLSLFEDLLYIRPRGEKDFDTVVSGFVMSNNKCIFNNEDGCMLDKVFRPTEGLLLIPYDENHFGENVCISNYDTKRLVSDWKKYQKVLLELKKYYQNKSLYKGNPTKEDIQKYETKLLGLKSRKSIVK